ncbi:hypothetical protein SAMN05216215_103743 [Saccharopolyspora shandongensis]|uniref:Resolvase, N terminal domain n=1 Tax=Saccharopolyspora shandongensis TaxID=418495 RepID=A0A1H3NAV7_9PSEU|nr:hypothetical protein SAMN05216215_103743 [Saccharopolyspora shandongensis]
MRFAFYGRMSTSGFQDPGTPRAWQRAVSEELVEGFGEIMVDFFDGRQTERARLRVSWRSRTRRLRQESSPAMFATVFSKLGRVIIA